MPSLARMPDDVEDTPRLCPQFVRLGDDFDTVAARVGFPKETIAWWNGADWQSLRSVEEMVLAHGGFRNRNGHVQFSDTTWLLLPADGAGVSCVTPPSEKRTETKIAMGVFFAGAILLAMSSKTKTKARRRRRAKKGGR